MKLYAVILAGGVGSRFWPRSKKKKPKQMLRIFGENTMIQDTVNRLAGLVPKENIIIVTNKMQKDRLMEQLPRIPETNIIAEPFGKNTAAAIGLASILVNERDSDAVMLSFPADHLIADVEEFQNILKKTARFAYKSKGLGTIGITPTRPETGYGYIQFDENNIDDSAYKVINFAEKPNLRTAKRFMKTGDFLWNSGMFIWHVQAILREIEKHLPDLYLGIKKIEKAIGTAEFESVLENVYGRLKSISIDYGVMEKSKDVFLAKGDFGWNDVGSWEAVYQLSEKDENENAFVGDIYSMESKDNYVFSPQKFTAVIGAKNMIIINTKNALLVCNRNNSQDVKSVVDYLKMKNIEELL